MLILTHRYMISMANSRDCSNLFCRLWEDNGHRKTLDINRRPFRIAVNSQVFVISANTVFSKLMLNFFNGLFIDVLIIETIDLG